MSVESEIKKMREQYRSKKSGVPVAPPDGRRKALPAGSPLSVEPRKPAYWRVFLNIMKRDILFKLGIQTKADEREVRMSEEYRNFMEAHFK